ncbi:MAG: type IV toxin-antitoxin system AbiEi family antitoxin domain-containing protein [Opitutales bacterium]
MLRSLEPSQSSPVKLEEWFSKRPVFTLDEVRAWLDRRYSQNERTRESLLSYHLKAGHLVRVKRGLYAVVPPGSAPETTPVDPWLVAAKSAEDSVLAYHTALELHGKARSVFEKFYFQTSKPVRTTTFRGHRFVGVLFPKPLRERGREFFATTIMERSGIEYRATSLERTLVDLHARPDLGGGWEEIWRSLESVEYFDLDLIADYVELLSNRTTAAKVGWFLERHAEALMVEERHLERLRKLRPKQPHYMERSRPGTLVGNWNLVVPKALFNHSGEEPA